MSEKNQFLTGNKIQIDASLVHRLIAEQFPQWADLPIKPIKFSGWDNRTFHLGRQMTVRLPSAVEYSSQVEKEQHWLPKLAPHLPLQIPNPVAMGKPSDEYPWHWSIYKWLGGKTATNECITDLPQFATALAEFLLALQQFDTTGGPMAGPDNFYRGGLLTNYDDETRQAIATHGYDIDAEAMTAVWNKALASTLDRPPVWVHGDIAIGNLLVDKGQLCAVIDFGQLGVGDPACDLAIAWTFFKGKSREAFHAALPLDNATWERARGWVLWKTLCTPVPGTNCQETINQVLADVS